MAQLLSGTRVYGNTSIDSVLIVGNVTPYAATSNSTGSLQVTGGVGITGNTWQLGKITAGDQIGNPNIINVLNTSLTTGINGYRPVNLIDGNAVFKIARVGTQFGSAAVELQLWDSNITTPNAYFQLTAASNTFSIADRVTGTTNTRLNIGPDGSVSITTAIPSASNTSGSLQVAGGLGVAGNIYSGNIIITGTTSNGITFPDGTRQTTAASGSGTDQYARDTANLSIGVDATQNTWISSNVAYFQGIEDTQNTNITAVNNKMQSAYNSANTNATNLTYVNQYASSGYALSNTNQQNIVYVNEFAQSGYDTANAVNGYAVSGYALANTNATNITYVNEFAQSAYDTANGANGLAAGAYNQANVTVGVDATQNTQIQGLQGTNDAQNTTISIIQGVDLGQNATITSVNQFAQAAYDQANTATGLGNIIFNKTLSMDGVDLTQNASITAVNQFAQSAYTKANNALANTTGTFAGDLTVTGNVYIGGTANLTGNLITNFINTTGGTSANLVIDPDGTGLLITSPTTPVAIQNTYTSTSNTTGALVVSGGLGVSGNINASLVLAGHAPRAFTATNTSSIVTTPSYDQYSFTSLSTTLSISTSGNWADGQKIMFRFLDAGTAAALSWSASYVPIGVTLPTSTTPGKTTYVGCIYNLNNTRWDVIAVTTQA